MPDMGDRVRRRLEEFGRLIGLPDGRPGDPPAGQGLHAFLPPLIGGLAALMVGAFAGPLSARLPVLGSALLQGSQALLRAAGGELSRLLDRVEEEWTPGVKDWSPSEPDCCCHRRP